MLHVVLYTILSLELIKTKTYYLNAAHNLLLLNELYSVYLVNILLKCCLHWKALKIEWTRRSRKKETTANWISHLKDPIDAMPLNGVCIFKRCYCIKQRTKKEQSFLSITKAIHHVLTPSVICLFANINPQLFNWMEETVCKIANVLNK